MCRLLSCMRCFRSYFNYYCTRMFATMLRQTRYQQHDLVYDVFAMTQLRLHPSDAARVLLHDSLAQATFRIERVDHKLNLTGESVRKLEFSFTVGFPECNGFARVDVDLKVGGVSGHAETQPSPVV